MANYTTIYDSRRFVRSDSTDTTVLLPVAAGGSGANLGATGGANQFVRQSTVGGAFTVAAIGAADITTITLKDTNFTLQDDGDTTKQIQFQLSSIATATTRTLTVPNASFILAGQNIDNAFSVDQTVNAKVGIGQSPSARLHIGLGGTGTLAEELRIDSGSGSGASATVGFWRNGVNKAYIGLASAANDIINGAANNDLTIRNNQAILISTTSGVTPQVTIDASGNVGIGKTPSVRLHVGAGTTGTNAEEIRIDSGSGSGGYCLLRFSRNAATKAAIGVSSNTGDIITGDAANDLSVLNSQAINFSANGGGAIHVSINTSGTLSALGSLIARNATAIPAGGTAGVGVMVSSTSNFGVFFGSGAPTLSAAKGSLYLRSDGTTTNDRAYINSNGSTTWTSLTTAA